MEHLRDEFDAGGFVGVLLFEVHDEAEGAVFKGRVGRTDDDGVPVANHKRFSDFVRGFFFLSEDGGAAGLLQGGGGGMGTRSSRCRLWERRRHRRVGRFAFAGKVCQSVHGKAMELREPR